MLTTLARLILDYIYLAVFAVLLFITWPFIGNNRNDE